MAGRPRKDQESIGAEIEKQEAVVLKIKEKYDAEMKKLKELYTKRDEIKKKELMAAVEKSSKTYEEIMRFLTEGTENDG